MVAPGQARVVTDQEGVRVYRAAPSAASQAPDGPPPAEVVPGTPEAARRQDFILQETARTVAGQNRKPQDLTLTSATLTPEIDPKTGLIKEDAQALEAALRGKEVIDSDSAGPIGPGRRERLAEIAGISAEEARKLWPYPDPKPFTSGDMAAARKAMTDPRVGLTQESVAGRLQPDQKADREEIVKNAVLTDSEASFAVYAALGFPFPMRVGKVDCAGITADGLVLFSPQVMRADPMRDDWEDLVVTFRWMYNNEEVFKDTIHVAPYARIPRPSVPVTHCWITCDRDVMAYAPRGVHVPGTLAEVRDQVIKEVVPVNSWLRQPTKIYGIRWGVLPTVDELAKNPSTRAKLGQVLQETGLMRPKSEDLDQNEIAADFRAMADYAKKLQMPSAPPRR